MYKIFCFLILLLFPSVSISDGDYVMEKVGYRVVEETLSTVSFAFRNDNNLHILCTVEFDDKEVINVHLTPLSERTVSYKNIGFWWECRQYI